MAGGPRITGAEKEGIADTHHDAWTLLFTCSHDRTIETPNIVQPIAVWTERFQYHLNFVRVLSAQLGRNKHMFLINNNLRHI